LKRSALYRFVHTRAKLLRARSRRRGVPLEAPYLRASQEALLAIQREAAAHGARVLLVLFPRLSEIAEAGVSLRHHDEMARFAADRRIEVLHLPRLWRERGAAESLYLPGEQVHLSARGYGEVAAAIAATRTLRSR
jgi:hypothetical protein